MIWGPKMHHCNLGLMTKRVCWTGWRLVLTNESRFVYQNPQAPWWQNNISKEGNMLFSMNDWWLRCQGGNIAPMANRPSFICFLIKSVSRWSLCSGCLLTPCSLPTQILFTIKLRDPWGWQLSLRAPGTLTCFRFYLSWALCGELWRAQTKKRLLPPNS